MDSNTHSLAAGWVAAGRARRPRRRGRRLAAQDLDRLQDWRRAERVLALRRLVDRLEGHWLKELAGRGRPRRRRGRAGPAGRVDRRLAAAPAAPGRRRGHGAVRTARALFRGPLPRPRPRWPTGASRSPMPGCWPTAPKTSPTRSRSRPNRSWSRRPSVGPARLRRVLGHLRLVADPEGEDDSSSSASCPPGAMASPDLRGDGRRRWIAGTRDRPDPAGGPGAPGPPPADARTPKAAANARGRVGRVGPPQPGRGPAAPDRWGPPQLMVTMDLDSLLGHPDRQGGEIGGSGPLDPEACRRLACDGAVTRVLVTRHPHQQRRPPRHHAARHRGGQGLAGRLRAAVALLPRSSGAPPPSRWRSAGPAGSCSSPSAPSWPFATGAVCSPAAPGRWPGGSPSSTPLAPWRPDRPGQPGLLCRAHHRAVHRGLATGPPSRRTAHRRSTASKTPRLRPDTGGFTHRRLEQGQVRPVQRRAPSTRSRCRTAPGNGPGPATCPRSRAGPGAGAWCLWPPRAGRRCRGPQSGSPTWAGWLATSPQSSAASSPERTSRLWEPGVCPGVWNRLSSASRVRSPSSSSATPRAWSGATHRSKASRASSPRLEQFPVGPLDQVAGPREPRPGPVAVPGQVPADVVQVQVGEDDQVDLVRLDPGRGQLLRQPSRDPDPGGAGHPGPADPGVDQHDPVAGPDHEAPVAQPPAARPAERLRVALSPRRPAAASTWGKASSSGSGKSPVTSHTAVIWTVPTVRVGHCGRSPPGRASCHGPAAGRSARTGCR